MTTPRHGHAPIQMRRLLPDITDALVEETPWEELPNGGRRKLFHHGEIQPGDFYWNLTTRPYLAEQHPEQRELVIALPTASGVCFTGWPITHKNPNGAQWTWNEHEDSPTLSPSLHWINVWHGWVRDGMLVEA